MPTPLRIIHELDRRNGYMQGRRRMHRRTPQLHSVSQFILFELPRVFHLWLDKFMDFPVIFEGSKFFL